MCSRVAMVLRVVVCVCALLLCVLWCVSVLMCVAMFPCRGQQLLQKERMLKEEVEEMKLTLSSWEENGARASAQRKQMVRDGTLPRTFLSITQQLELRLVQIIHTEERPATDLRNKNKKFTP